MTWDEPQAVALRPAVRACDGRRFVVDEPLDDHRVGAPDRVVGARRVVNHAARRRRSPAGCGLVVHVHVLGRCFDRRCR